MAGASQRSIEQGLFGVKSAIYLEMIWVFKKKNKVKWLI